MLRSCLAQVPRSVASTSHLHTSAVLRAKAVDLSRKVRREQKQSRRAQELSNRPSPVLGTRPGEESKWLSSDLAKVLVDESAFESPPAPSLTETPVGKVPLPKQFGYGITGDDIPLLFHKLPDVSSTRKSLNAIPSRLMLLDSAQSNLEAKKAKAFAMTVDLRNANADGIHYENKQRIIREFSTPENPFDPGRIEVQAAILTYRVRNMWKHMSSRRHKKDVASKRHLRELVYARARALKYLKRVDKLRYDIVLGRLGLERGAVEGELMV